MKIPSSFKIDKFHKIEYGCKKYDGEENFTFNVLWE